MSRNPDGMGKFNPFYMHEQRSFQTAISKTYGTRPASFANFDTK